MKLVIQRVKAAKVTVDGNVISSIDKGLLILAGIGKEDKVIDLERAAKKVANLRIFDDGLGKMNLNIKQIEGAILSVPQFTLYADIEHGNRPGFKGAAQPKVAQEYWGMFNSLLQGHGVDVKIGIFGEHMEVQLINDGPVTIIL